MSGVDLYYEMCAAAARVRAIHLRHLEALGAPLTAIAVSTCSALNAHGFALTACLSLIQTGCRQSSNR